jgi:hypothetical protein
VHVVFDSTVKWSSNSTSQLSFLGGQIHIEGTDMTATLDASKKKLTWNDGDVWTMTEGPKVFTGAWADKSGTNFYVITDNALRWSAENSSKITISGGQMEVDGATATLEGGGKLLKFSDGDIWTRATFDGYWGKVGFLGSWMIETTTLTTKMQAGQTWSNALERPSPLAIGLTITGESETRLTGSLDPTGMLLSWSDGDIWSRAMKGETQFTEPAGQAGAMDIARAMSSLWHREDSVPGGLRPEV